ncbi:MAG: hypothetical protein FWC65_01910 [Treponema sp.]|nr:hypothetical protein [Treponema sp.]
MKRKNVLFIFLAAFIVMPAFAERIAMPPIGMPTAASSGFGGTHVAYTDNVFALLVNPAAMMRVQQRSFFTIAGSLFSPQSVFQITDSVIDMVSSGNTAAFGNMADALSRNNGKIVLGLELREFPLSIAWVANGLGFGLWNHTFVKAEIVGTTVRAAAYSDIMLPIGLAFRVLDLNRHSIDAGFTVKPFLRMIVRETASIMDLMGNYDLDFTVPVIAGGGLDLGLLYRWDGGLQVGLTFTDVLFHGAVVGNLAGAEDANTYYIPFAINAGISQSFRIAKFLGITFAADWRDIGNAFNQTDYLNSRNFLLDFGAGIQVSLFDTFFLRAGMSEMLPAAGFGIYLGALRIDAAYYGREFGYEPGQLSAAVVDVGISIRPKTEKRNWGWTRRSVMGLFGVGN